MYVATLCHRLKAMEVHVKTLQCTVYSAVLPSLSQYFIAPVFYWAFYWFLPLCSWNGVSLNVSNFKAAQIYESLVELFLTTHTEPFAHFAFLCGSIANRTTLGLNQTYSIEKISSRSAL